MNFQNDVAEGEDACPESNYAIVEAEIVRHLQGRSGKIVAIKVSNHVEQEHIRRRRKVVRRRAPAGNIIDGNGWGRLPDYLGRARCPEKSRDYILSSARGAAVY